MTASASAKKDVQRLQRAIVDGLEDVKGQDIVVFDTEALSPLFERVIIASGTSNRQTKALAASVRDAVREAGFSKPRVEGEDNGEWIIVDCGAAVAHIMQPAIRQYYHLEEIWGDKPVRLKFGAPNPMGAPDKAPAKASGTKPAAKPAAKPAKKEAEPTLRRSSAAKTAIKAAEQAAKPKAPARKTGAKPAAKPKTVVVGKKPAAKTAAKPAARKPAAKKAPARKA